MRGLIRRRRKPTQPLIEGLGGLCLRVSILKGKGLQGTDKLPVVSPYAVLRANHYRFSTHTVSHVEGDPEWNSDFVVSLSGYSGKSGVSIKVWDKERFRKNYVGELLLSFDDLFPAYNNYKSDDPGNQPRWFSLHSLRPDTQGGSSGQILVKFSLESRNQDDNVAQLWFQLLSALEGNEGTLGASVPNTFESVSLVSGDEGETDLDDEEMEIGEFEDEDEDEDIESGIDESELESDKASTSVPGAPVIQVTSAPDDNKNKVNRRRRQRKKQRKPRHYEFNTQSNVVGVAFLDVVKVTDLPPERNVTRTGFDMDPFVVVSFGKKTFRTPWKRHTLNPVFNEKMLFPVQKHEQNFSINLVVMDKDRFSLNDFVADCNLSVQELIQMAPTPDPVTGLYDPDDLASLPVEAEPKASNKKRQHLKNVGSFRSFRSRGNNGTPTQTAPPTPLESESSSSLELDGDGTTGGEAESVSSQVSHPSGVNEHKEFVLPLKLKQSSKYETKNSPQVVVRGRFLPYAALRQHFWRGLIRIYDIDDTETISYIELTTMLDSLGSTLSRKTKEGFFQRFERPLEEELSIDEVVICLEEQIVRDSIQQSRQAESYTDDEASDTESAKDIPVGSPVVQIQTDGSTNSVDSLSDEENGRVAERVIQLGTCPVCNQPRLGKRSEMDIVTHLATCASQNWGQVDTLIMDRYVTSNQARKRWYSKIISKVSYGKYNLGANSANILVQDRVTGLVIEEKMSAYVRLGIRLLYKGIRSSRRMETKRIRAMLRSLSVKQGRKYDNPASVQSIMPFIKFHNLYMDDVLEPVENFKSFNEFFYRKLKPGARKCDAPENPNVAVSPADCRTTMYQTVTEATEVWIKGREFSIKRLFGDAYPDMVDKFTNGSLAIFRLAPQDYHRFHIPVDGVLGQPKQIDGDYYTVNPMAIRSALDVYGENVRVLVPLESEEFGTVMVVCIGAMMVGSTVITAKKGEKASRLDELGYFQFGGSTLVVLFQPGKITFDEDLRENSKGALETLVRVGMSIGHHPDHPEWERQDLKSPEMASEEQKKWAKRIITGDDVGLNDEETLVSMFTDI